MKAIKSAGGPFIALEPARLGEWSGVFGRTFIGDASPFENDYEAASDVTDGRNKPPVDIAVLRGPHGSGVLISMPLNTALIMNKDSTAYLAQVHYCEPQWSFKEIESKVFSQDFLKLRLPEQLSFHLASVDLCVFDAAYPGLEAGSDCLRVSLPAGAYTLQAAYYEPDDLTLLTLLKIEADTAYGLG